MKKLQSLLVAVSLFCSLPAFADSPDVQATMADIEKTIGFVPSFFKAFPASALPGTWDEMKALQMSPTTAIPVKYKELIGLAVSSQIPCKYCILAHTAFAKGNGATNDEIGLAVAAAGSSRHWSTWFNGMQLDEAKFKAELTKMVDRMKKLDPKAEPAKPATLTDDKSAFAEMEAMMGFVPEFMKKFPAVAVPGAWRAMRDIEMNPSNTVPAKYVSMMGLAVSSQIPCKYCIIADTEFAKAAGATDAEIAETVAMAAHTRNMSTLLNGMLVDENAFKADLAKLTKPQAKGKKVAGK